MWIISGTEKRVNSSIEREGRQTSVPQDCWALRHAKRLQLVVSTDKHRWRVVCVCLWRGCVGRCLMYQPRRTDGQTTKSNEVTGVTQRSKHSFIPSHNQVESNPCLRFYRVMIGFIVIKRVFAAVSRGRYFQWWSRSTHTHFLQPSSSWIPE